MSTEKKKDAKPLEAEEAEKETAPVEEPAEEIAAETRENEAEALKKSYDELYEKHLRTLAEYENYKRRTQKEKAEIYLNAQADTVGSLLPVLDNLERAAATEETSPLAEGVQMVLKQLIETLSKLGVNEIEAVGAAFDPNLHNAVMHIEDEELGENIVAEQFAKGYIIQDKVIRHSMVKVAN
ncbi:MAG: nucleotide exchange factor GrpE [Ruminococcaceae bacterium]|nr:nucleotide exchange factor GrpE [Oscillospiraceae bacterium]